MLELTYALQNQKRLQFVLAAMMHDSVRIKVSANPVTLDIVNTPQALNLCKFYQGT